MSPRRPVLLALLALCLGCAPEPLPTAAAVASLKADPAQPALAQLLYSEAALPSDRPALQRVRILVWLRAMDLDAGQLDRLAALHALADAQRARVGAAERAQAEQFTPKEDAIYEAIWERLAAGAPDDDPALLGQTQALRVARSMGGNRTGSPLTVRLEGITLVLEAMRPFLDTLSDKQEAALNDSLFLLRHRLDPVGTPGDFEALVGSTYDAGEQGILFHGTSTSPEAPLDLGGLWSDAAPDSPARRDALPEARREALLYLALLEPTLPEAIAAARAIKAP